MEQTSKLPDIRKTRILDEPIEKVWNAVATSAGIAAWFVPNDFEPAPEREFHVDMEAPQGRTACRVTTIDAPAVLSYRVGEDWSWTFELKKVDDKTELTFTWSGWDRNKSAVGMPHTALHEHLTEGTNVLVKRLVRSVREKHTCGDAASIAGEGDVKEAKLQIDGMSCGHCVQQVESVLERFGLSGQVKIGSAVFRYNANRLSLAEVKERIEDLGYDVC